MPTSSGLRRARSASAPTSTPNSRYGSQRAALTSPTSAAEPDSVVTTSTWIASVVIGVPKSDTVLAVQKSRKPAWVRSRIAGRPYRRRLRLLRVMPVGRGGPDAAAGGRDVDAGAGRRTLP